jgi:hypothetical protein
MDSPAVWPTDSLVVLPIDLLALGPRRSPPKLR